MPPIEWPCLFCGGDPTAPDHDLHCDGKQGGREEPPTPAPDPPPVVRIKKKRDTSAHAFYNAVDAGMIKTRREQVWVSLRAIGPATANEVYEQVIREHTNLRKSTTNNTRARMTELRDLGLIREVGERPCRVTKQTCILWEIVPSTEYVGVATVHRCPHCKQTMYRDVPTTTAHGAHV